MSRLRKLTACCIMVLLLLALAVPGTLAAQAELPTDMGVPAYAHTAELAVGPRVAGTGAELEAARMVSGWFAAAGYSPESQKFVFGDRGQYHSQNIVVHKSAVSTAADVPLIIVGAHYDSVAVGKGADDNASGVAAMLEVARRLQVQDLPYDITFIAFGAEEVGLKGSKHYVCKMSDEDKTRTIAMINFDSLIVGDFCYIHAGLNEKTWARDAMLGIAEELQLPIITHDSPKYPAGLTPNGFSDYTAFNKVGIPIVALEATNWEIGDLDGYEQTEEYGSFWHTANDDLDIIEDKLPGRPMEHLSAYTTLVWVFLRDLTP